MVFFLKVELVVVTSVMPVDRRGAVHHSAFPEMWGLGLGFRV
jgi:hypothetical protein